MTGFSREMRQAIKDREGQRCIRCGALGGHAHHRRPLGMGGDKRPETNQPANGLYVCLECHAWIHAHPKWALRFGYLVTQEAKPAEVPVFYMGEWVLFDDESGVNPIEESAVNNG